MLIKLMRRTTMSGSAFVAALALLSAEVTSSDAQTPVPESCVQTGGSWVSGSPYDTKQFGNYFISNDNFNNTPKQKTWAKSQHCFGATTTSTSERSTVGSYPHIVRGWMQNDADMRSRSSSPFDWTTKSGMGIPPGKLGKAKVHWAFKAPTTPGSRWNALIDVYFHKSATPAPGEFPPALDLQIFQSLADQVINRSTYFAYVADRDHATTVTLAGVRYLVFIDDSGGSGFHQPGGHTIALFNLPTSFTSKDSNPIWGVSDGVTDVAAIIKYFAQPNPVDDAGHPLRNADGAVITSPLISPELFLTAINAGWEIDVGTTFVNTTFCVAMQNEPDCP